MTKPIAACLELAASISFVALLYLDDRQLTVLRAGWLSLSLACFGGFLAAIDRKVQGRIFLLSGALAGPGFLIWSEFGESWLMVCFGAIWLVSGANYVWNQIASEGRA